MTDLREYLFSDEKDVPLELAVEHLVLSVQVALQQSMHSNCVSQKELAERLGVSAARVSQILSGDQANLTLKTIAKIAHALGEEFEMVSVSRLRKPDTQMEHQFYMNAAPGKQAHRKASEAWKDMTANENLHPRPLAA